MITLASSDLQFAQIAMELLGGLALFLFGMELMTDALKAVAGGGMQRLLGGLTRNRFTAAITGAFVTAVIQSSSVTTVLVVGFISAGILSLTQSVGVIMGANIGTTITAQIIAFKITKYALLLIAIGFAMLFISKREKVRLYGKMIMGLGMIFFGMGVMSEATSPLRTYEPFIDLMGRMSNPFLGILVAAGFTALVQSSSATTGIVIVLASQGFITLEAGIALAFGANIGTCVTAVLAALGKPRAAAQAAGVHLVFNVLGVLIWLPFIGMLAEGVQSISPAHPELTGAARLAAETPRQIANAHTLFNIANTLLFIGFTGPMAWLVTRLLPEKPAVVPEITKTKYLDDILFETPTLAIDRVRLELVRFGEYVGELTQEIRQAIVSGTNDDLDGIVARQRDGEKLRDAIATYSRKLGTLELTAAQSRRLAAENAIANNIQHVSEVISIDAVAVGRERITRKFVFSEATQKEFAPLGELVWGAFAKVIDALEREDAKAAKEVVKMKPEVQGTAQKLTEHLAKRLHADEPDREILYRVESQIVEMLLRNYYFAKKIAKTILTEHKLSIEEPLTPVDT